MKVRNFACLFFVAPIVGMSGQGLRMNKEHAESLAKDGTAGGT